ncbi:MAG: PepSY domain-containing protein [Nitrospiraceae bacterium]|nr:PepSY domain-containing protein [Nitrospiraceae bacterium]
MKKMMTVIIGIVLTALIAVGGVSAQQSKQGTAPVAHDFNGRQYAKDAKISLDHARRIAQKACAGVIVAEELEKESGGTGLRYSFDIRKDGITREVGVDAVTGAVLENSTEGAHPD